MSRVLPILLIAALAGCATVQPPVPPPDAQVGVAFSRDAEVASFAEGFADPPARRVITPDDPVRVASISKLVVGIGVMKLVEQGKLGLDTDVSRWLGWSLRNPAFPDRPISLRLLLSHTSAIRDHDDQYAIPLGGSVRAVMADPKSWDLQHGPGANYFYYSNMNFPIVASIVELITGERFDVWMRREVLDPMKLDACYNWPACSDATVARAVVLMQNGEAVRDDLKGKRPDCPVFVKEGEPCDLSRWRLGENGALFSPQGGLRVSARGLARVGRMLLNGGELDGVRIVSPASIDTLFAPVWRYNGSNGETEGGFYCSASLASRQIPTQGRGCADDIGTGGAVLVGHAGDAYGLRGGLWIDRARGHGVAYFVTGLPEDPPRASGSAFRAAEAAAFRRTYALLPR
jgi:CubicO group peptidase (beta-lactamase class C family)